MIEDGKPGIKPAAFWPAAGLTPYAQKRNKNGIEVKDPDIIIFTTLASFHP